MIRRIVRAWERRESLEIRLVFCFVRSSNNNMSMCACYCFHTQAKGGEKEANAHTDRREKRCNRQWIYEKRGAGVVLKVLAMKKVTDTWWCPTGSDYSSHPMWTHRRRNKCEGESRMSLCVPWSERESMVQSPRPARVLITIPRWTEREQGGGGRLKFAAACAPGWSRCCDLRGELECFRREGGTDSVWLCS